MPASSYPHHGRPQGPPPLIRVLPRPYGIKPYFPKTLPV